MEFKNLGQKCLGNASWCMFWFILSNVKNTLTKKTHNVFEVCGSQTCNYHGRIHFRRHILGVFQSSSGKTREVPIGLTMHYLCPCCLCCIARCRHIWRLARICSCVSIQQSCLPHRPKKHMSLNGKTLLSIDSWRSMKLFKISLRKMFSFNQLLIDWERERERERERD